MEKEIKDTAQKAKELSEQLHERAKDFLGDFGSQEQIGHMKESMEEFVDDASRIIRKYPLQSVLGAAAIGFLLASLIRRK